MARKKAMPKAFKVKKDWRPSETDEALHNEYVEKENEYSHGIPPPIIDGKPFIWTQKDHDFVKAIYNSRPTTLKRTKIDYIVDGVYSDNDAKDFDFEVKDE